MKTVLKQTKRFAAVFLALAMVVLSLPQSALTVKAENIGGTITIAKTETNATITGLPESITDDGSLTASFTVAANDNYYLEDSNVTASMVVTTSGTPASPEEVTVEGTGASRSITTVDPGAEKSAAYTVSAVGSATTTNVTLGDISDTNIKITGLTGATFGGTWSIGQNITGTVRVKTAAASEGYELNYSGKHVTASVESSVIATADISSDGSFTLTASDLKYQGATAAAHERTLTITTDATATESSSDPEPGDAYEVTIANASGAQIDDVLLFNGSTNVTESKEAYEGRDLIVLVKAKDHYALDSVKYKATSASGTGTSVDKVAETDEYALVDVAGKSGKYYQAVIESANVTAPLTITLGTARAKYPVTLHDALVDSEPTGHDGYLLAAAKTGSGLVAGTGTANRGVLYATDGTAIKFTVTPDSEGEKADFVLTDPKVAIGDAAASNSGLSYNATTGIYTLEAAKVTGAIEFTATENAPLTAAIEARDASASIISPQEGTATWKYGEALSFTAKHKSSYTDFQVIAVLDPDGSETPSKYVYLDPSEMTETVSKTVTGQSDFTIPYSAVENAILEAGEDFDDNSYKLTVTVAGVKTNTVTFKDSTGKHVTVDTDPSIKGAVTGLEYTFVLIPDKGYEITDDTLNAISAANENAIAADETAVYNTLTFYAVKSGATKTGLTMYPIYVDPQTDPETGDFYLICHVLGTVDSIENVADESEPPEYLPTSGVQDDLDIYIGNIATVGEYASALDEDVVTSVANATTFARDGRYAKVTYGEDYKFTIQAAQTEGTFKLSSVKWVYAADLEECEDDDAVAALWAAAETASAKIASDGKSGEFAIAGNKLTGNIVLLPVIYEEITTTVTIADDAPLTGHVTALQFQRSSDAAKAYTAPFKARTGEALNVIVTTDGTVRLDETQLKTANSTVWDISEVTASGNSYTVKGKLIAKTDGDAHTTTLTIGGVAQKTFTIETAGKTTAITDLQVATEKDDMDTPEEDSDDAWIYESYTGTVTLDTGDNVSFRFKLKKNYEVVGSAKSVSLNAEDGFYYPTDDIQLENNTTETLTASLASGLMRTVYVYNADPTAVTKWQMKPLDSNTKDEIEYIEAYTASGSKLAGIRKNAGSETNFDVVQGGANANIVITGTVASKDLVVTAAIGAKTVDSSKISQTGTNFTLTLTKADVANEATITLNAKKAPATNGSVIVYSSGATESYAVDAKVDDLSLKAEVSTSGSAKALEDAGNLVTQYIPGVGDKVTLNITPVANYTISAAGLYNLDTGKTTNVTVESVKTDTPKDYRSVTTTVTTLADSEQALIVVANPDLTAQTLAGTGVGDATETSKTAFDKTLSTTTTVLTYEGLQTATAYTPSVYAADGAKTGLSKVELVNGSTVVAEDTATFTIPASLANKQLKVRMTYTDGTVFEAYNVKAKTALTKATISGVSKNAVSLEPGTQKIFNITGLDAGANAKDLTVKVSAFDKTTGETADLADGLVVAQLIDNNKKLQVYTTGAIGNDNTVYVSLQTAAKPEIGDLGNNSWFVLSDGDSNVKGSAVTVTLDQKTTTNEDLGLKLTLPSKVNSNTLKNLIDDNVAEDGEVKNVLVYEITYGDSDVLNVVATSASQNVVVPSIAAAGDGSAQDVKVTVRLLLTVPKEDAVADALDGSTTTIEASDIIAENVASGDAVVLPFKTRAVSYPTSISLKAKMTTLYAGKTYTKDATLEDDTDVTILADVTLDANAVYPSTKEFAVNDVSAKPAAVGTDTIVIATDAADDDGIKGIPAYVVPINGKLELVVPTDTLNTDLAAAMFADTSAVQELQVIAPTDTNGQTVAATLKLKVDQLAVDANVDESPADAVTIAKKSGAAANTQLGIEYKTGDGITATKAAVNQWTWAITSPASNVGATISQTGKFTVDKDMEFTAAEVEAGKKDYTVTATSKNNSTVVLTYTVKVVPQTAVKTEGELVLVNSNNKVVAKKGEKFTWKEYSTAAAAGATLKLLEKGAVIKEDGSVDAAYILADQPVGFTSSNVKVATVSAAGAVSLTRSTTGSVTFSATAPYTGTKKSLSITIQPNTNISVKNADNTQTKTYFSLGAAANGTGTTALVTPAVYATDKDKNGADFLAKKATLTVTTTAGNMNTIFVQVLKGQYTVNGKNNTQSAEQIAAINKVDDFYTASQLKAGKGVKIVNSDPAKGIYELQMFEKTGTVTMNGVTYTITNNAKAGGTAGTVKQVDSIYGDYGFAQTIQMSFTPAKTVTSSAASVVLEKDTTDDKSTALSTAFLAALESDTVTVSNNTFALALKASDFSADPVVDNTIANGSYTLYATFKDIDGNAIADPLKITLKATSAPAFNPAKAYTVTAVAGNSAFRLISGKDYTDKKGNAPIIVGFENVNTKGSLNEFTGLIETDGENKNAAGETLNGSVQTEEGATLLEKAKNKDNLKGIVYYTTDNGKTTKSVQVTLTVNAGLAFYKAQLEAKIAASSYVTEGTSTWSAQDTTAAKAKTKLESLISVPSNITLAWDTSATGKFVYTGANKTNNPIKALNNPEAEPEDQVVEISGVLKLTDKTAKTNDSISFTGNNTIKIVPKNVTVETSGIGSVVYSIKDGAGTVDLDKMVLDTHTDGADVVVPHGAVLSVKTLTSADGYKADTYYVGSTVQNISSDKKSGAWSLGEITDTAVDDAVIYAMNTVTMTRDKNIDKISATYQGGDAQHNAKEIDTKTKSVSVVSGTNIAFEVITKEGYDAVMTEKVGSGKVGDKLVDTTTHDGTAATYSTTSEHKDGTKDVKASVLEPRTYAFTTQAHTYTLTVNYAGASGVYSDVVSDKGTALDQAAKVPVEYGKQAKFRLVKKAGATVGKAKGNYTVTYTVTNATAAESAGYTTVTTKDKMTGDAGITVTAAENLGVTVDTTKALKGSVSAVKVNGAAYSKEVPLPENSKYTVEYTVKGGYKDTVTKRVGSNGAEDITAEEDYVKYDPMTGKRTITIAANDLTADTVFTVTTEKTTVLSYSKNGPGAPITGLIGADTYIDSASYRIYSNGVTKAEEEIGNLDEAVILGSDDEAVLGSVITLKVTTKSGYDLWIATMNNAYRETIIKGTKAPASFTADPKKATDKLYCVSETADGTKTWIYSTTVKDALAEIYFEPVAQARTATIKNLASTNVSGISWLAAGMSKATSGTTVKSYYKDKVTIQYTAKANVIAVLVKSSTKGEDPVLVPVETESGVFVEYKLNANGTKTYTWTVELSADEGDTVAYSITTANAEPDIPT